MRFTLNGKTIPEAAPVAPEPAVIPEHLAPYYKVDRFAEFAQLRKSGGEMLPARLVTWVLRSRLAADPGAWERTRDKRLSETTSLKYKEDLREQLEKGPGAYVLSNQELLDTEPTVTEAEIEAYLHQVRLIKAEEAYENAQRGAAHVAKIREEMTCRVCGEHRQDVNDRVLYANGRLTLSSEHLYERAVKSVRACTPCGAAITAEASERVSRDRREAAARWLDTQGVTL